MQLYKGPGFQRRRAVPALSLLLLAVAAGFTLQLCQAQRNVTQGQFKELTPGWHVAIHMVHVPYTNKFMFMDRLRDYDSVPVDGWTRAYLASMYDLDHQWATPVFFTDVVFCSHHLHLEDGSIAVVGGDSAIGTFINGTRSMRVLNPITEKIDTYNTAMKWGRWYPSVSRLLDGRLMIVGGTARVDTGPTPTEYEIWDPKNPTQTEIFDLPFEYYWKALPKNYYPFLETLHNGDNLMFIDNWTPYGVIIRPHTGQVVAKLPDLPADFPADGHLSYPLTSTGTILPLNYSNGYLQELVTFGGSRWPAGNTSRALEVSLRLPLPRGCGEGYIDWCTRPNPGADPSWQPAKLLNSTWSMEVMPGGPRVMGATVVLPNGMLVVMNGAQYGMAGLVNVVTLNWAGYPNLNVIAYDPRAPLGSRFSVIGRTTIPRLYHNNACLTQRGTILSGGSDTSALFDFNDTDISLSPTGLLEHRVEEFTPPYILDPSLRPTITWAPDTIYYDDWFTVAFIRDDLDCAGTPWASGYGGGVGNNTGCGVPDQVVLVTPCSATHSLQMNSRTIVLEIKYYSKQLGVMWVAAPPSDPPGLALPGVYLLFLANSTTQSYSKGSWVKLARNNRYNTEAAAALAALPPIDAAPPPEDIPAPAANVTAPAANVTDPTANFTAPAANVTAPAANVTDPAANVTAPAANVTDPAANVTDPATNITAPAANVTAPAANVTAPAANVTAPAANVTAPAANATAPAANVTAPAANVTDPATNVTAPAANVTAPAANVTAPAANITAPAANVTAPAANVTAPAANVTITSANVTNPAAAVVAANAMAPGANVTISATNVTASAANAAAPAANVPTPNTNVTLPTVPTANVTAQRRPQERSTFMSSWLPRRLAALFGSDQPAPAAQQSSQLPHPPPHSTLSADPYDDPRLKQLVEKWLKDHTQG